MQYQIVQCNDHSIGVAMQLVKRRMETCVEGEEVLGELHNRF